MAVIFFLHDWQVAITAILSPRLASFQMRGVSADGHIQIAILAISHFLRASPFMRCDLSDGESIPTMRTNLEAVVVLLLVLGLVVFVEHF